MVNPELNPEQIVKWQAELDEFKSTPDGEAFMAKLSQICEAISREYGDRGYLRSDGSFDWDKMRRDWSMYSDTDRFWDQTPKESLLRIDNGLRHDKIIASLVAHELVKNGVQIPEELSDIEKCCLAWVNRDGLISDMSQFLYDWHDLGGKEYAEAYFQRALPKFAAEKGLIEKGPNRRWRVVTRSRY